MGCRECSNRGICVIFYDLTRKGDRKHVTVKEQEYIPEDIIRNVILTFNLDIIPSFKFKGDLREEIAETLFRKISEVCPSYNLPPNGEPTTCNHCFHKIKRICRMSDISECRLDKAYHVAEIICGRKSGLKELNEEFEDDVWSKYAELTEYLYTTAPKRCDKFALV